MFFFFNILYRYSQIFRLIDRTVSRFALNFCDDGIIENLRKFSKNFKFIKEILL